MHGGTYIGTVDRLNRPNGLGKEYFAPLNQHRVRYYGYYLNGKKHGNGTLYNNDGEIYHHGEFLYGKPIININGEKVESVTTIPNRIFKHRSIFQRRKKQSLSIKTLQKKNNKFSSNISRYMKHV